MSRREWVVAHVAILGVLGGSFVAVATDAELFPFSSYPMYSRVSRQPYDLGKFMGVIRDAAGEHEVPFDRSRELFPFNERTLRSAVSRLLREDGPETAARALGDELALYNARRAEHGGEQLDGLRYYTVVLAASGDEGLVPQRAKLLVEAARR